MSSDNLLYDIRDCILDRTNTNAGFAETLAAAVVSTAIGPHVMISDKKGDVFFNIFGLVVGGSRISDKTVAVDITREIVEKLEELSEATLKLAEKFSIEGLSKDLLEQPDGIIIGDEYTSMFKAKSKTWLVDSMEFLSKLYDGRIPMYSTIARGKEYVPRVHVNFVTATTFYLCKLMKSDDFFIQGTGNRFLWDVDDYREIDDISDLESVGFFLGIPERKAQDDELIALANRLNALRIEYTVKAETSTFDSVILGLDLPATVRLGKFMATCLRKATALFNKDVLDPDVGYIAGMTENAIKLAGIHCVSRSHKDEAYPEVSLEDVEWAINKVELHLDNYHKIREIRDRIQSDKSTSGHKSDFDRVLAVIDQTGKANKTKIMTLTNWFSKDTQPILDAMVATYQIMIITRKTGPGKRNAEYYRYVKGKSDAEVAAKERNAMVEALPEGD